MRESLDFYNQNLEIIDQSVVKINAINFNNMNDYYCRGYVVFYNACNELSCCVVNSSTIAYIDKKYGSGIKLYFITKKELLSVLEQSFGQLNIQKAQNYLSEISTICNAKTVDYKKMITGFLLLFALNLLFFPNLFHVINNVIYLMQNILKALLFKRSIKQDYKRTKLVSKKYKGKIPIYTIFVPLYKEVGKLKSIIKAIDNLSYPKSKLDVKFIVEVDDKEMNKALSIVDLPKYIHVIKVPVSFPRTKPKAMNYAISYVKGEYLCVYDAEDRPDSDQLLKALQAFKELSQEYACVQARLNFYNPNENMLTSFFSIEYSLWFEYLLKGLNIC